MPDVAACWWAQFTDTPCWGRLDPCHFIPQRVLKREHSRANPRVPPAWFVPSPLTGTDLEALLADSRNWRPGCRGHHHPADNGFIEFKVPDSTREFAAEHELDHLLPVSTPAPREELAA